MSLPKKGGNLSLIAEFPDRAPVVLSGIAEDDPRPNVDTSWVHGANMKELRFDAADGVWRVAFAVDPKRDNRSSTVR